MPAGTFQRAGRDTTRTEELRTQCANVHTWVGDFTSVDSCVDLVSSCVNQLGRLDLLVNNAGIYHAADAEHTTDEVWLQTIAGIRCKKSKPNSTVVLISTGILLREN
jgi:NAD(P)-dependent dehydrogenase (short-subunit alcohol dehydrogenase family)